MKVSTSTTSDFKPAAARRNPLALLAGGCAILAVCLVLACAANASYWMYRMNTTGMAGRRGPAMNSGYGPTVGAVRGPTEAAPGINLEGLPAGNAESGEQVFNGAGACSACHSLESGERKVGPSLSGVAERAALVRPGYTAEMYLYESIVKPDASVVESFHGGIMPDDYGQRLSEQQIADLMAFLMVR